MTGFRQPLLRHVHHVLKTTIETTATIFSGWAVDCRGIDGGRVRIAAPTSGRLFIVNPFFRKAGEFLLSFVSVKEAIAHVQQISCHYGIASNGSAR